jgi:hypothetical protein
MIRSIAVVVGLSATLSGFALAQQPDMAALQKWMASDKATWRIVGAFTGETAVSSDQQGFGQVSDTVEFSVTVKWLEGTQIVGTPKLTNVPASVGKLRDAEPKCMAPQLKGPFDYARIDSVTQSVTGTGLHLKMTRTFPEAVVSQVCTSKKTAPAKAVVGDYDLFLPQPTFLAMGLSDQNIQVSKDKKSIIMKNPPGLNGWTWTLTPTPG